MWFGLGVTCKCNKFFVKENLTLQHFLIYITSNVSSSTINRSQKGVNNVDEKSIILKSGLTYKNVLQDMEHLHIL